MGAQCPPPTSCRSVAHGRATQPSPLPATTRTGLREAAASEDRPACALRPAESLLTLRQKFWCGSWKRGLVCIDRALGGLLVDCGLRPLSSVRIIEKWSCVCVLIELSLYK